MKQVDVVVIGAGMVGAAVALGFAQKQMKVALVEPNMPQPFDVTQPPDVRVSAISLASEQFLRQLGAWEAICAMRVHPYSRLAVWEEPGSRTDFDAQDCQYDHMGYMVENRILQLGLHQILQQQNNVLWFSAYDDMSHENGTLLLDGKPYQAQVIVAADGAQSRARQLAGIGTSGWQYQQSVLSVTAKCKGNAGEALNEQDMNITWQQFTPNGPRAFLPLFDHYASFIWYDQNNRIKQLSRLSNAELKKQLQASFPALLPEFDIVTTASFPLTRMHAKQYVKGRLVLVGDAAHTINPLAGQGVNLGFKDAEQLLKDVCSVSSESEIAKSLAHYQRIRQPQNLLMMSTMDALYAVFSNELAPIKFLRNVGLTAANRFTWAKQQVMKYAMGMM
ncbi:FAD-dependent monooxygenase [Paraneptunicella aestuarii]|uniref:FAD-dependent monooxygenase n=1 Tax=Paraneptunicella aestuarii TaxID=2831148 RepID=UPI001E2A7B2E|nr:FAD-dependent monooxygenase [Paraneptunicella aestuarii]